MTDLPLAHVRVVDLGQYIAGPAAAMMLADQGADVIHIDPPGGPRWSSPAGAVLNRRKRCISLDLKDAADLDRARNLVAGADVLIENFRPGVMARLGLGPKAMRGLNPGLIYVSLPGFASSDRQFAAIPAWESVIAAAAGQFTDMGLNRVLMGINPSFSPLCLPSAYGAVLAATAAVAALHARDRDGGEGDHIEVPLAAALMEGLAYNSMRIEPYPERYRSPREREIARRRHAGMPMDLNYAELQALLDPFYRSYVCADDRPLYVVCASHRRHVQRLLEQMNLLEPLRAAGIPELGDWYLPRSEWPAGIEGGLGLYPTPEPWASRIAGMLATLFRTRPSFEWERKLGAAGIPVAAHRLTSEWLQAEHPIRSGLLIEGRHPEFGSMRQIGPVAWLAETAEFIAGPADIAAPDGDRAAILAETAERRPIGARPAAEGRPWFDGLRVLDLTNVIAGPTVGALLARFGASVVKLDPTLPDFDPWTTIVFGMQGNVGKRSLLADLKTPEGHQVLHRLLCWADLVTANGSERQLAALGLTPAELAAVNPRLLLCRIDAFGGPRPGPRGEDPGYDDLIQASTGIMARFGGSLETPEEHAHVGTIDVLCGYAGALAAAIGLLHRQRTGKTTVARASLAAAGQLIQAPFMYDFPGRPPHDEPSGPQARGDGPLHRCYETADGWFFLAATSADWPEIARVLRIAAPDDLAALFRTASRRHWIALLSDIDVAAVAIGALAAWRDRAPDGESSFQFCREDRHPSGRRVTRAAPAAIRPARAPLTALAPAEKYGAGTRAILGELGYSAAEIDRMLRAGAVSEGWSRQYLPD